METAELVFVVLGAVVGLCVAIAVGCLAYHGKGDQAARVTGAGAAALKALKDLEAMHKEEEAKRAGGEPRQVEPVPPSSRYAPPGARGPAATENYAGDVEALPV